MEGLAKVLEPLPETYLKHKQKNFETKKFFETLLPDSDKKEVGEEFKKTLVLSAQNKRRQKNNGQPRISKRYLTSRERRQLCLYRLPKTGLKYDQFRPLHDLWVAYMEELLGLDGLEKAGWTPGLGEDARQEQLQTRLCRADLHGALVKVTKASCPSHVGVTGIIALESRNTVQIISKDNKLRIIPKIASSFTYKVSGYVFTLPGSSIDAKPADRVTKKLKNKIPFDF